MMHNVIISTTFVPQLQLQLQESNSNYKTNANCKTLPGPSPLIPWLAFPSLIPFRPLPPRVRHLSVQPPISFNPDHNVAPLLRCALDVSSCVFFIYSYLFIYVLLCDYIIKCNNCIKYSTYFKQTWYILVLAYALNFSYFYILLLELSIRYSNSNPLCRH